MTDASAPSRPLKLRCSCDNCGAAKLKCDRGQPDCGRCVALGLVCVYGVSRKSGKPSRARQTERQSKAPYTPGEQAVGMDVDKPGDSTQNSTQNSVVLNSGPLPSVNNVLPEAIDDNTASLMTGVDASDPYVNLLAPSLTAFTSLDLDEWVFPSLSNDNLLTATTTSPLSASLDSACHPTTHQSDQTAYLDNISMAGSRGHDCPRDAYAVLASLSFLNVNQMAPMAPHSGPTSAPALASTLAGTASRVPLDLVLRLNREACEHLHRLLTCSCAKSPHSALLYASIFSRMLIWYQQAAGCTHNPPWSPTTMDAAFPSASASTSASISTSGSSPWLSTAVSAVNTGCTGSPTLSQTTGVAVAPTQMAMGSFHIDDDHVQTAIKIQLVLSEMKKAGCVLDLFTSDVSSGQSCTDGCSFDGVDSLYRSLKEWLRGEHSRIASIMRSRLSELSDNNTLD